MILHIDFLDEEAKEGELAIILILIIQYRITIFLIIVMR